jgi:phage N-6-adenine-methyltransferase
VSVSRVLFSSKTPVWETPQDLFDRLNAEFGFTVDVCALPENAKCERFYTPEIDGLTQRWEGVCWCNPPYGRGIDKWIRKAYRSSRNGATVVCLVPARTDTAWFHDYVQGKSEIRFVRGRLRFGSSTGNAPFPSMIVIYRPEAKS